MAANEHDAPVPTILTAFYLAIFQRDILRRHF
jgi:hypothetical protein